MNPFRYTSDTVFDTFPWPQFEMESARGRSNAKVRREGATNNTRGACAPQIEKICAVADAARALRRQIMEANDWSLRDLYRTLELPGDNKFRNAHAALDAAVRAAYGMKEKEDILAFLLKLNLQLAEKEAKGEAITPPGLPSFVTAPEQFISGDCVRAPGYPPYEPVNTKPLPEPNPTQAEADSAHYYSAKEDAAPYRTGTGANPKQDYAVITTVAPTARDTLGSTSCSLRRR